MSAAPDLAAATAPAFPGGEYILAALFLLFVATTAAGTLLAVLTTRIIRSVCGLAVACIGLAGLYYFLNSPFLALMELLIYVGAVCVTIVFAVMLSEPDEPQSKSPRGRTWLWTAAALVVSATVLWNLARLGLTGEWNTTVVRVGDGSVREIGVQMLTTYSLAFEVISLVLLVAILGALAIARTGRHKE